MTTRGARYTSRERFSRVKNATYNQFKAFFREKGITPKQGISAEYNCYMYRHRMITDKDGNRTWYF